MVPHQIVEINSNTWRLSSAVFSDLLLQGEVSVDRACKTRPLKSLERQSRSKALTCLHTKRVDECDCETYADPEKTNPAHAVIVAKKQAKKHMSISQLKKVAKRLAKRCTWIIPPKEYCMVEPIISECDIYGV